MCKFLQQELALGGGTLTQSALGAKCVRIAAENLALSVLGVNENAAAGLRDSERYRFGVIGA